MDFSGNSWLKALHRNSLFVENAKKVSIGSEIFIATELYFLYTKPIIYEKFPFHTYFFQLYSNFMENQMKINSISVFKGFSMVLGVLVLKKLNQNLFYHTLSWSFQCLLKKANRKFSKLSRFSKLFQGDQKVY